MNCSFNNVGTCSSRIEPDTAKTLFQVQHKNFYRWKISVEILGDIRWWQVHDHSSLCNFMTNKMVILSMKITQTEIELWVGNLKENVVPAVRQNEWTWIPDACIYVSFLPSFLPSTGRCQILAYFLITLYINSWSNKNILLHLQRKISLLTLPKSQLKDIYRLGIIEL